MPENYRYISEAFGDGATLEITIDRLVMLFLWGEHVIGFNGVGMTFPEILEYLDKLARRYCEDGIIVNEIVGEEIDLDDMPDIDS